MGNKNVTVTTKLTPEQARALDKLIKNGKFLSRSEAVRNIVKEYLEKQGLL